MQSIFVELPSNKVFLKSTFTEVCKYHYYYALVLYSADNDLNNNNLRILSGINLLHNSACFVPSILSGNDEAVK